MKLPEIVIDLFNSPIFWSLVGIFLAAFAGYFFGIMKSKYDRNIQKDQEVLKKLLDLLPSDSDTIIFLRTQDFGGEFEREFIRNIQTFWNYRTRPEFFFLNKKLENTRKRLFDELSSFLDIESQKAFRSDTDGMYLRIPQPHEVGTARTAQMIGGRAWEDISNNEKNEIEAQRKLFFTEAESDFRKTVGDLNTSANKIVEIYDELIRKAKETL